MDRVTWGDRLFDMRTNPQHRTFVLEAIKQNPESGIVGYITINQEDSDFIQIDEVAVNPSERGKSYGPLLVRFAENLARHGACKTVRLFSIENRVKFYQDQGYKVIQGDDWIALDDEHYIAMGKRILHHITR